MRIRRLLGVAVLVLAGCRPSGVALDGGAASEESDDSPDGGQPQPYCEWETTPLGEDEESPLGFTPNEVLEHAAGEHVSTLEWQEVHPSFPESVQFGVQGVDSTFTGVVVELELAAASAPRFVDGTAVDPAGLGLVCHDYVAMDAVVSIETMDGVLAVEFDAELFRIEDDAISGEEQPARVAVEWPGQALQLVISKPEGGLQGDETRFALSFTAQGFAGQVDATISDADGEEFYSTPLGVW